MVYFQTKNPNLGKFGRALDWKMFIYFMAILNILKSFGIFYDHLVYFVVMWYIFPSLGFCIKKNLATLYPIHFCSRKNSVPELAKPVLSWVIYVRTFTYMYVPEIKSSSVSKKHAEPAATDDLFCRNIKMAKFIQLRKNCPYLN
jgi:hypothetical protein